MRIGAVSIAWLLLAACAQADQFRYEVDGGYVSDDADFADSDALRLGARFYFQPISDADGPFAEAAFLRPASNVGLSFGDTDRSLAPPMPIASSPTFASNPPYDIVFSPSNTDGFITTALSPPAFALAVPAGPGPSADTQSFDVRYEFVSPTRWIASVQIGREDGDSQSRFTYTDNEDTTYALEVGKYINATTTVSLGFRYTDMKESLNAPLVTCSLFQPCTFEPGTEVISTSRQRLWRARARHLRPLGQMHFAVQAEARYGVAVLGTDVPVSSGDPAPLLRLYSSPRLDSYGVNVAGTLYPRANLGIALELDYDDGEGLSTNSVALSAQWFVSRSIALSARLGRVNADRSGFFDNDTDSIGVGVLGRF